MDGRLRGRIAEMSRRLAIEEKERLEAAGTFVDLERLTMEIGDELARQLAGLMLSSRAENAVRQRTHCCPKCGKGCCGKECCGKECCGKECCGKECEVEEDPEPLILQGMRGEIEYQEPRCHCSRCRRAFFPSGQGTAATAS